MKNKEKYVILRDRAYMLCPSYWNCIVQTNLGVKRIYGRTLSCSWMKFYQDENGIQRGISFYPKKDLEAMSQYIAGKLLKDKKYFSRLEKGEKEKRKAIIKFLSEKEKESLSGLGFDRLLKLAEKIQRHWTDYDIWTVPAWFIAGDEFKELARKKIDLPENDSIILMDPLRKTYTLQLEEAIIKYALAIKEDACDIKKTARKLSRDFGWMPFGYDGPEYWDSQYFVTKLQENLGKKKEILIKEKNEIEKRGRESEIKFRKAIKKHKLNSEKKRLVNIMHVLSIWTDERKALDYRLNYYYAQILYELGKRFKVPYKNLKYLFLEELKITKNNKNKILRISNERINKTFIIEYKGGRGGVVSSKKKNKLLREWDEQMRNSDKLKGAVACHGPKNIYRGKVKILSSARESGKIKNGDFLVATMTTPDYILAMQKAAGFITDEGGVTCHAAIVAREMNKPCIIGTKNATRVLRDGDLVEVDMERGTIKKI